MYVCVFVLASAEHPRVLKIKTGLEGGGGRLPKKRSSFSVSPTREFGGGGGGGGGGGNSSGKKSRRRIGVAKPKSLRLLALPFLILKKRARLLECMCSAGNKNSNVSLKFEIPSHASTPVSTRERKSVDNFNLFLKLFDDNNDGKIDLDELVNISR